MVVLKKKKTKDLDSRKSDPATQKKLSTINNL